VWNLFVAGEHTRSTVERTRIVVCQEAIERSNSIVYDFEAYRPAGATRCTVAPMWVKFSVKAKRSKFFCPSRFEQFVIIAQKCFRYRAPMFNSSMPQDGATRGC